jgi:NAD/NADP octopine/nopaline dehydrogenase, alpha-helical domain
MTVRAKRLPTGVFPLARKEHALALISRAFPGVIEECGDALSAALMNAGPIIHPPLIIMNAGALQHFERWDIHKEGTQPAIRRVTDALDGERIALREALGYGAPHFPLANHYASAGEEWMYGRGSHDRLTTSGDWREQIALTAHGPAGGAVGGHCCLVTPPQPHLMSGQREVACCCERAIPSAQNGNAHQRGSAFCLSKKCCTLPSALRGNASTNTTSRGTLKRASSAATCAAISSGLTADCALRTT